MSAVSTAAPTNHHQISSMKMMQKHKSIVEPASQKKQSEKLFERPLEVSSPSKSRKQPPPTGSPNHPPTTTTTANHKKSVDLNHGSSSNAIKANSNPSTTSVNNSSNSNHSSHSINNSLGNSNNQVVLSVGGGAGAGGAGSGKKSITLATAAAAVATNVSSNSSFSTVTRKTSKNWNQIMSEGENSNKSTSSKAANKFTSVASNLTPVENPTSYEEKSQFVSSNAVKSTSSLQNDANNLDSPESSKKSFKRSNSAASGDLKPVFSRSLANKIANAKNAAQLRASVNKSLNSSMSSSLATQERPSRSLHANKNSSNNSDAASSSTGVSIRINHAAKSSPAQAKTSKLSTGGKNETTKAK